MPAPRPPMTREEAVAVLGLAGHPDEVTLRSTFRARLRDTHPDLNPAEDATERTVRLTAAYRIALAHLHDDPSGPPEPTEASSDAAPPDDPGPEVVGIHMVDADTLGIAAPAAEVIPLLIEAAHQLGDITYLDPAAGLLEVIVEFVGAPTSSVVLSLQGRATGVTEVFCSVEPLSGGEAPAGAAVTALLCRTLQGEDPTA